jgi:hypothetical protein
MYLEIAMKNKQIMRYLSVCFGSISRLGKIPAYANINKEKNKPCRTNKLNTLTTLEWRYTS